MPKRFSRSGAFSNVEHRAYVAHGVNVAQASWLHTAHSLRPDSSHLYKMAVGAGCASPDFARPPHSTSIPTDRGTIEISGANLMYEGARVKSWMLGRDVNPAGRGDGAYYAQGAFSIGSVRPSPTTTPIGGWGNSVNNGCGGGCGPRFGPPVGPWNDPPVLPPKFPGDISPRPARANPSSTKEKPYEERLYDCIDFLTENNYSNCKFCKCAQVFEQFEECTQDEWIAHKLYGVGEGKNCCKIYMGKGRGSCYTDCAELENLSPTELRRLARCINCWELLCNPNGESGDPPNPCACDECLASINDSLKKLNLPLGVRIPTLIACIIAALTNPVLSTYCKTLLQKVFAVQDPIEAARLGKQILCSALACADTYCNDQNCQDIKECQKLCTRWFFTSPSVKKLCGWK